MMMRNASRRYAPEGQPDVTKPDARVSGAATKRRVLGDITNAFSGEESKDSNASKKPTSNLAHAPQIRIEVADDVSSVRDDRDYMRRESDDIDARDAGNPLLATCYVNEMYENFGVLEKKFAVSENYMADQKFINERMRTILIDWLVEIHLKFKMVPETLYLTVDLIDRYLETKQIRRSKLQLVGVSAMLLAAKYEEIYPPEMRELVYITDRAYVKQEILEMEADIAITLNYNLTVPTTHSFLCRYLKAAHADRTMVQLACYLAERTLQEYGMIKFLPSVIAATAVYIARKSLKRHAWSPTLVKYTNYDECDMVDCAATMESFVNNAAAPQQAVVRKYSSPKFGEVAKMTMAF